MTKIFNYFRKIVYLSLWFFDSLIGNRNNLFIICYHSIDNGSWLHSVKAENFKKQIEFLLKDFNFITLENLYDYLTGEIKLSKPSVVLTFDDGYKSLIKITDFLEAKKITPTVFLVADSAKADIGELGTKEPLLSDKDISKLIGKGWGIGCHSLTHRNFSNLTPDEINREVLLPKRKLERSFGVQINYFAYPRGKYDNQTSVSIKEAGYKMALSMDDGVVDKNVNIYAVPKIAVNRSHDFWEFKTIYSPSVIAFRKLVKASFLGKYL